MSKRKHYPPRIRKLLTEYATCRDPRRRDQIEQALELHAEERAEREHEGRTR